MKSDPFAPATSPKHIKNIRRGSEPEANTRWLELITLHLTDHERVHFEQGDGVPPSVDELERRQTLVEEYRVQLGEEGPDADPPAVEDLLGNLYVWREGDRTEDDAEEPSGQPDGETSSGWVFVPAEDIDSPGEGLEVPPRNGPGSDTETWRAFAAAATSTDPSGWATMNRTEIIAHLEKNLIITSEQA